MFGVCRQDLTAGGDNLRQTLSPANGAKNMPMN